MSIIFIGRSFTDSRNFSMQSLPLYTSCLCSDKIKNKDNSNNENHHYVAPLNNADNFFAAR